MEAHYAMNPQPTTGELLEVLLDFRDAVSMRFNVVDSKLREHSRILGEHSQILNRHERRLDSIGDRLHSIDGRLSTIENRVQVIEQKVS